MPSEARLILVVDDNPDLRETVSDLLAELGHVVSVADSAESALEWLRRGRRPDLVITDQRLSGQTGLWLILEMHRDPAFADVPAILMTGGTLPSRFEHVHLMQKPFDMDLLLQLVDELCALPRRTPASN